MPRQLQACPASDPTCQACWCPEGGGGPCPAVARPGLAKAPPPMSPTGTDLGTDWSREPWVLCGRRATQPGPSSLLSASTRSAKRNLEPPLAPPAERMRWGGGQGSSCLLAHPPATRKRGFPPELPASLVPHTWRPAVPPPACPPPGSERGGGGRAEGSHLRGGGRGGAIRKIYSLGRAPAAWRGRGLSSVPAMFPIM